jgi:hypothetical protein
MQRYSYLSIVDIQHVNVDIILSTVYILYAPRDVQLSTMNIQHFTTYVQLSTVVIYTVCSYRYRDVCSDKLLVQKYSCL